MPGHLLTTASTVMCSHGGQALLTTANTEVSANRGNVLLENDIHTVAGCPFTVGTKYSPCVRIEWSAGASRVVVNETATLTKNSIGRCLNGEGGTQGVAVIVSTQRKAAAQ